MISAATTWGYASEWGSPMRIIPIWAAEHPDSPRAQRTYAQAMVGAGLPNVALDELDQAYRRFPYDLSIPIMSIDITCRNNKPLRYHFKDLAAATPSHRMTDGLRPSMESIFTNIHMTGCRNQTTELHSLVPALFNLENNELWHRSIAGMYVLSGDLYLKEKNPSEALTAYQIIDQITPTAASAQRIAGLYLLVQQFDDARHWLTMAQSREQAGQTWHQQNRDTLYEEKFRMIDKMQTQ
jgi:tetratricopeptide (TPR) repeat protein